MMSLRYLWYIQVQVSKRQLGIMRKKPGMEERSGSYEYKEVFFKISKACYWWYSKILIIYNVKQHAIT